MFIKEVIELTKRRIKGAELALPLPELKSYINYLPPPRDFAGAIKSCSFSIISEIKRASPSKGWLRKNLSVKDMVQKYVKGGAAALSVLTEPHFFRGSLEDLKEAKMACPLPILRKDFIISPYQIYESKLWGADAILLIASILSDEELKSFLAISRELKLTPLVEVHDEGELYRALNYGCNIIGINNRDLNNLEVDPERVFRLRPLIPSGIVVVAESGITSKEDIERLRAIGVRAALIGEALVTAPDPERKLKELIG